ncbi:MAG: hypothetical protein AYK22_04150 [Thermoplasmatales archaeon SG8-52-3]|nr:MAG: hypothetical protein AYK22_04150 [Thermoplasmatales archaeon SG8-52-3]
MSKENKINLKLEVFKDKSSGKLSLMAHFDKSAPNIYKEKDNFLWAPTVEEKDFLFEAFNMIPEGSPAIPTKENKTDSEEQIDNKERPEDKNTEKESNTNKIPTEEKSEELSSISETSDDYTKDETQNDIDDSLLEELNKDELKNLDDEKDNGLIVEADGDAIDEAIKKHAKDDESIVEADEQTIIDKVLSQKKKGRWSRK